MANGVTGTAEVPVLQLVAMVHDCERGTVIFPVPGGGEMIVMAVIQTARRVLTKNVQVFY